MKIAVLLSGGVDSSVALSLLKKAGHQITAFYLKIWLEDELAFLGECPWEEDLHYARKVCEQQDVDLQVISLQREYHERVVKHTIEELKNGYTPSPDIFCNQRVKFGVFLDEMDDSFEKIATGHYARLELKNRQYFLKTGVDPVKDQTYFLSHLAQSQLERALFPIGSIPKSKVRDLAREFNLSTKDRKDSQGICFLGKIKFSDFVKYHLGEEEGSLIELETGKILGRHFGYWYYTIGQRKGIGLHGGPWYVVKKDIQKNIVYISHQEHRSFQSKNQFTVQNCNWIVSPPQEKKLRLKLRHGPKFYDCHLKWQDKSNLLGAIEVTLDKDKDPGIAAGQYAVFYDEEICLGCGKIQFFE